MDQKEYINRIEELELELSRVKRENKSKNEIEKRFISLANTIPAYIAYVNANTLQYEYVNDLFEKSFGILKEKIIGSHIKDVIGEANYKFALRYIEEVRSGKSVTYENTFDIASGKRWIQVNYSPVFDESNNIAAIALVSHDITDFKQTEKALMESDERFQLLFNKAPLGYQSLDFDGNFIEVNQQWLDTLGYEKTEVLGKWFGNFLSPAYQNGFRKRFPVFKEQGKIHSEFEMIHKNGNRLFIAFEGRVGYDKNGKFMQTHCILQDITEQKKSETALMESENKYRNLVENSPDAIIIYQDREIVFANQESLNMVGAKHKDDLAHKSVMEFVHPGSRALVIERMKKLQEVGTILPLVEERFIRLDGSEIDVEVKAMSILFEQKNAVQLIIRNITERKKAEEILLLSEIKFREIFEENMDGITILSINPNPKDMSFFDMNENSAKMLGYTREELFNINPVHFEKNVTKEGIERRIEELRLKGFSEFETVFNHKNGNEIVVEIKAKVINYNNQPAIMNIVRDISERKRTELALIKAKEKAEESDRLKSAFLANMSHEIRTPMNGILGFAELLREPTLTSDEQLDFIQTIQVSGERMLNTINNIVDVSKIESGLMDLDIKTTNINTKMEFAYKFFKPEVEKKGLQLIFKNSLSASRSEIKTDAEKVYAILTNLIKNAIKFTFEGSIEFGYVLNTDSESDSTGQSRRAELEFYVKDTGVGIPQNQTELIFERFRQGSESHSRKYEGSGLGLSICKSYVEMLGGRLWIESVEGKGTTFYFTIPYNNVTGEKIEKENDVSSVQNEMQVKKLKTLIVEDDEISYSLLLRTIKKISYEVIHSKTGLDAIEACRNNPDIDLVLMDIKMPKMDGLEATTKIRQFNKEVIIIAQSAYGFSSDSEKALKAGCNDYITKPINRTLLFELIKMHVK